MHFPSIPKIVFQTSKLKPEAYVLDQIKLFSGPQWSYFHFDDNAILDFFNKNPIPDFPDVISKFNSFKKGAHKADLFRYYYIYLKGGIFIDSDAIPRYQLDSVIKDCDFFSVESSYVPNSIFQGFIGATPNHPIIYEALKNTYWVNPKYLDNDYHYLCKDLLKIIKKFHSKSEVKLLKEAYYNDYTIQILNHFGDVVLLHYWRHKIIPKRFFLYL